MSRTVVLMLALGLVLLTDPAHGFTIMQAGRPGKGTTLHAASLPLLDTYPSRGPTWTRTARQNRIDRVLQDARNHQRRREGLSTVASPKKYVKNAEISAATSLPFSLPILSTSQLLKLERDGEIVMEQSEMGLQGSGFVVQDIHGADEAAVWNALLDFDGYTDMIHTVRSSRVRSTRTATGDHAPNGASYGIPSATQASFEISKFRLNISCEFKYNPEKHYMELSLDNALQNSALQTAKGFWYTERRTNKSGIPITRVWLLCDLTLSPFLPKFIVDLAAESAMPRASTWLQPAIQKKTLQGQPPVLAQY